MHLYPLNRSKIMARILENPLTPFVASVPLFAAAMIGATALGVITTSVANAALLGLCVSVCAQGFTRLAVWASERAEQLTPLQKLIFRIAASALAYATATAFILACQSLLGGVALAPPVFLIAFLMGAVLGMLINLPHMLALHTREIDDEHFQVEPYFLQEVGLWQTAVMDPDHPDDLLAARIPNRPFYVRHLFGSEEGRPINRAAETRAVQFAVIVADARGGELRRFTSNHSNTASLGQLEWNIAASLTQHPIPVEHLGITLAAIERLPNRTFNIFTSQAEPFRNLVLVNDVRHVTFERAMGHIRENPEFVVAPNVQEALFATIRQLMPQADQGAIA